MASKTTVNTSKPTNQSTETPKPTNETIDTTFKTPISARPISAAVKRTAKTAFPQDSPFVIPPSPLMKRLGCGTHVTIYRYKRQKTSGVAASPWAIKKANKGRARKPIMDRLAEEAKILRSLNHPNIVVFKKFTKTPKGDVCLSMEAFGKGLDDIIYKHQEKEEIFSAIQITQVAFSISNALEYLHNTKKLLHGDMKSGNILVKGKFELIKLCDFGVSIFMKDDLSAPRNTKAMYVGSEPWHSMEIKNGDVITDKADIFSFGLVLWEMLALDVPHVCHMHNSKEDLDGSFLSTTNDSFTIPDAYFDAIGTRPAMPDFQYSTEYDPVIGTFICCTIEDYTRRPSAHDVATSLKAILPDYNISNIDGSILQTELSSTTIVEDQNKRLKNEEKNLEKGSIDIAKDPVTGPLDSKEPLTGPKTTTVKIVKVLVEEEHGNKENLNDK
eukprot:TCONS_00018772-protein